MKYPLFSGIDYNPNQKGSYSQHRLVFAVVIIASPPVLLFYATFQRKIIAGITTTGMAGQ